MTQIQYKPVRSQQWCQLKQYYGYIPYLILMKLKINPGNTPISITKDPIQTDWNFDPNFIARNDPIINPKGKELQ